MLKGLMLKDLYVIKKQLKAYMVLMVICALVPSPVTQGLAVIYASIIPVTAAAFDEQAGWDYYAQMLPYRSRELVISKYLLGIGISVLMAVLIILSNIVVSLRKGDGFTTFGEYTANTGMVFCISQILMSVNLPLVLKLGAEKGRLLYIFVTMAAMLLILNLTEIMPGSVSISTGMYLPAAVVLTVVAICLSIGIADKIYGKKRC